MDPLKPQLICAFKLEMKRKYFGIYRKTCVGKQSGFIYVAYVFSSGKVGRFAGKAGPTHEIYIHCTGFLGYKTSLYTTQLKGYVGTKHIKMRDLRFPQRESWFFVWDMFFVSKYTVNSYWMWGDVTVLWNAYVCHYLTSKLVTFYRCESSKKHISVLNLKYQIRKYNTWIKVKQRSIICRENFISWLWNNWNPYLEDFPHSF